MGIDARIPMMYQGGGIEPVQNALMRASQLAGQRQSQQMNALQMDDYKRRAEAALRAEQEQAAQRAMMEQFMQRIPSPRLAPLGGNASPSPDNAAKLGNDPRLQMMWEAMQAKVISPTDYMALAFKEPTERIVPRGATVLRGDKPVFTAPEAPDKGTATMQEFERAQRDPAYASWLDRNRPARGGGGSGSSAGTPPPPPKPLPTSALKMQQEALDAIGVAASINADLGAIEKQINDGKLEFGPVANLVNQGRNMAGFSDQKSRNFATFKSNLERLRNESLRLNTGVQTDGDAQRAWNELFQNITDTDLVKQRLQEIQRINARGVELQRLKIDQVRSNYGHEPLDVSRQANQQPALTGEVKPNTGSVSGGWGDDETPKVRFLGFEDGGK